MTPSASTAVHPRVVPAKDLGTGSRSPSDTHIGSIVRARPSSHRGFVLRNASGPPRRQQEPSLSAHRRWGNTAFCRLSAANPDRLAAYDTKTPNRQSPEIVPSTVSRVWPLSRRSDAGSDDIGDRVPEADGLRLPGSLRQVPVLQLPGVVEHVPGTPSDKELQRP